MAKDAKVELLGRVPLFAGCSARARERVSSLVEEVDLPAGRVLTREGEAGQEFFIIVSGRVRVERGGRQLATLGPGDYLGEISLVDHGPRTATTVCEEPCRLLVLGHREFHSLLEAEPAIQLEILQTLASRVRQLEPQVV